VLRPPPTRVSRESKSDTAGGTGGTASDKPMVVGSTLSLTGAFAATGAIHKIAGAEFAGHTCSARAAS
jgi:hypothetical protein